jgi:hypothetical protein
MFIIFNELFYNLILQYYSCIFTILLYLYVGTYKSSNTITRLKLDSHVLTPPDIRTTSGGLGDRLKGL